MSPLTRDQLLAALDCWGTYPQRVRALSPDAQAAFLKQQGYARLGDLLAHVIAWWEIGVPAVQEMLTAPTFESPDVDVDEFNARAVERFRGLDEVTILRSFEALCVAWRDLVPHLPDEAFQNEKIAWRLNIELIGHLEEHELAG